MKSIAVIFSTLLCSCFGFSQSFPSPRCDIPLRIYWSDDFVPAPNFSLYDGKPSMDTVISTYDTTVLFEGIDTITHEHDFVRKGVYDRGYICFKISHGPEGCPDTWIDDEVICTICLRDFKVLETRTTKPWIDKFQEAKDRLYKLKNKSNPWQTN